MIYKNIKSIANYEIPSLTLAGIGGTGTRNLVPVITEHPSQKVTDAYSLREIAVREGIINIAVQLMRLGKRVAVDI